MTDCRSAGGSSASNRYSNVRIRYATIHRMLQTGIDFGVYIVVRAVIAIIQALPLASCEKIAGVLATLFGRVLRIRGDIVDENLRIAFPALSAEERAAITWQMWRHLILMMVEIAQTPRKVHETNWKEHSQIVNQELFVRTLLSGRPLVVISGHFGNFELGGYLMGLFGFPTFTVARALDNRFLDRFVNDFRGRTGQYMLPKKGSGADIQRSARAWRHSHVVGRPVRRPKTMLGEFLRQARVHSQSRVDLLPRQPGADDGQLCPSARSGAALRGWSGSDLRSARP